MYVCMYVCMYVMVIASIIVEYGSTKSGCQSGSWLAEREHVIFPPYSRLKIWFRETGSGVPSCASLLILHTHGESGAYSRDSSRFSRWRPFIYTAIRRRASSEFIGSRNCVPMAFTAECPPVQGQ